MGLRFSKESAEQKKLNELNQSIIALKESTLTVHQQDAKAELLQESTLLTDRLQSLKSATKKRETRDTCDEFLAEIDSCKEILTKIEQKAVEETDEKTLDELDKLEENVKELEVNLHGIVTSGNLKAIQELERTTQILYRKVEDMKTEPKSEVNTRREKIGRRLVRDNKKIRDAMDELGVSSHLGRISWPQKMIDQILCEEFALKRKSAHYSSLRANFLSSQLVGPEENPCAINYRRKKDYGGSMDFPRHLRQETNAGRYSQGYVDYPISQPIRVSSSEIKKYCVSKEDIV